MIIHGGITMKVQMFAALAAILAIAHSSAANAAGWRSCKASSAKCTVAQTNTVKDHNQRRAAVRHRYVNSMPARAWFDRQMLNN
jgi:hypothetical protein